MNRILKPKELWEQGYPLHLAWENYAPKEMREKLLTLKEPVLPKNTSSEKGFLEMVGGVLRVLQITQERARLLYELIDKIKDEVMCDLYNEDLYAYGYPAAPSRVRTPRKIDPNFWYNPEIDWDEGTAATAQYSFDRIRVVDPDNFPQLDLSPKIPGPKSQKDNILNLIKHHDQTEKDFWHITDGERIQRMLETINRGFPNIDLPMRGYSDKNFQKYLLEFRRINKAN